MGGEGYDNVKHFSLVIESGDAAWVPRKTVRKQCVVRARCCLAKRSDTVGQPPSAENCASHRPLWKAEERGKSEATSATVSRGNRLANSIRSFFETGHGQYLRVY